MKDKMENKKSEHSKNLVQRESDAGKMTYKARKLKKKVSVSQHNITKNMHVFITHTHTHTERSTVKK